MMEPVFFIFNVISIVLTYCLFCNASYIEKLLRSDGMYSLNRVYIIPDKIAIKKDWITALWVVFLCVVPMTSFVCFIIWCMVLWGYFSGELEVFGKNRSNEKQ